MTLVSAVFRRSHGEFWAYPCPIVTKFASMIFERCPSFALLSGAHTPPVSSQSHWLIVSRGSANPAAIFSPEATMSSPEECHNYHVLDLLHAANRSILTKVSSPLQEGCWKLECKEWLILQRFTMEYLPYLPSEILRSVKLNEWVIETDRVKVILE